MSQIVFRTMLRVSIVLLFAVADARPAQAQAEQVRGYLADSESWRADTIPVALARGREGEGVDRTDITHAVELDPSDFILLDVTRGQVKVR